jgi:chromosome segregation ATPase
MKLGTKEPPKEPTPPAPTTEQMQTALREQERRLLRAVDEAAGIEGERKALERAWSDALASSNEQQAESIEQQLQQLHAKRRRLDATIPGLRSAIEQLRERIEYSKVERRQAVCRVLSAESVARDRRRDALIRELAALQADEVVAGRDFQRNYNVLLSLGADGPVSHLVRPNVRRFTGRGTAGMMTEPALWCTGRLFYSDGTIAWPTEELIAQRMQTT